MSQKQIFIIKLLVVMSMKQYVEHCFVTEKTIIGRICDALHDLVQFVQFKKREKYPRRNVTRPATLRKLTPPWVFFRFLKLYKWYQVAQLITY